MDRKAQANLLAKITEKSGAAAALICKSSKINFVAKECQTKIMNGEEDKYGVIFGTLENPFW
jgi:hypothetical protein